MLVLLIKLLTVPKTLYINVCADVQSTHLNTLEGTIFKLFYEIHMLVKYFLLFCFVFNKISLIQAFCKQYRPKSFL